MMRSIEDQIAEVGRVFGRLTIIEYAGTIGGKRSWKCRCACGSDKTVTGSDLRSGRIQSCGCLKRLNAKVNGATRTVDLTGKRIGSRIVLGRAGTDKAGQVLWNCRCDCGAEMIVRGGDLRSRHSLRCLRCHQGNLQHGHNRTARRSPTYQSWVGMLTRCTNPNSTKYQDYGGRGIAVCERWLTFDNFLADMGERPVGKTIDRMNNDGNYEPGNCRWATDAEQRANKRR